MPPPFWADPPRGIVVVDGTASLHWGPTGKDILSRFVYEGHHQCSPRGIALQTTSMAPRGEARERDGHRGGRRG